MLVPSLSVFNVTRYPASPYTNLDESISSSPINIWRVAPSIASSWPKTSISKSKSVLTYAFTSSDTPNSSTVGVTTKLTVVSQSEYMLSSSAVYTTCTICVPTFSPGTDTINPSSLTSVTVVAITVPLSYMNDIVPVWITVSPSLTITLVSSCDLRATLISLASIIGSFLNDNVIAFSL